MLLESSVLPGTLLGAVGEKGWNSGSDSGAGENAAESSFINS